MGTRCISLCSSKLAERRKGAAEPDIIQDLQLR